MRALVFGGSGQIGRAVAGSLAQAGLSVFHTTSTAGMADFTLHLLSSGQTGTFNIADPQAMTTADLAHTLARAIDRALTILDASAASAPLGAHALVRAPSRTPVACRGPWHRLARTAQL